MKHLLVFRNGELKTVTQKKGKLKKGDIVFRLEGGQEVTEQNIQEIGGELPPGNPKKDD